LGLGLINRVDCCEKSPHIGLHIETRVLLDFYSFSNINSSWTQDSTFLT
jgi:hypothetical protein